ncbi:SNF2-related protein [Pseudomonas lini]
MAKTSILTKRDIGKMHDRVIGSLDRFKQEGHLESLMQADEWDLIIFDEGHRLSRRQYGLKLTSSDRYDLAAALRSKTKHLLLLSATPHQGLHDKFIALLELLRPDRHQELMMLSLKPEILHDMIYRNHKADVTDAEGNFIFFRAKITRAMRVPASAHSSAFDGTLQSYLRRGYAASAAQGRKRQPDRLRDDRLQEARGLKFGSHSQRITQSPCAPG